jgi:hypothetical protein
MLAYHTDRHALRAYEPGVPGSNAASNSAIGRIAANAHVNTSPVRMSRWRLASTRSTSGGTEVQVPDAGGRSRELAAIYSPYGCGDTHRRGYDRIEPR